jgi:hypothetical protein
VALKVGIYFDGIEGIFILNKTNDVSFKLTAMTFKELKFKFDGILKRSYKFE